MGEKYDELGISGLSRLMDEISLLTDAAENADESIDSIKLMTVHSSKGLEFKNVFLV